MNVIQRLWQMILGWGSVGVVYTLAGYLQPSARSVVPETALDRLIPFNPIGIWLYLSFFALIPLAYLRCAPHRLRWLARSMQLSALVSGVVYVLHPTTLAYPALPLGDSASATALRWLISFDSAQNCLPSLHGSLTALAMESLLPARTRARTALLWLWGIGIAFAVIQTRRHLAIDLSAGMLAGWLCGRVVNLLFVPTALCITTRSSAS